MKAALKSYAIRPKHSQYPSRTFLPVGYWEIFLNNSSWQPWFRWLWECIKDGWGSSRPCWGSLISAVRLKDLRKQVEAAALRIFCNYVHADSGSCLLGLSLSIHLVFSCSSSIVSCSVGSVVFLLPARQPCSTVKAYLLEAGCTIWLPIAQHMNFWFVCVRQHRHLLGVPVWTSSRFR